MADPSAYDVLPYPGVVARDTWPPHLDLCSLWHGGPTPSSSSRRVVELGCGNGTNLLPLAYYNPSFTFVGIDKAQAELERARAGACRLGLENISFVLHDVRDLSRSDVIPCDYLVAHGLYSWVPEDARQAILCYCGRALKPSGLAYISYNAQPGWAVRRLVRETLLRAPSVQKAVLADKAIRASEVATQLLEDLPSRNYAHAVQLAGELERVCNGDPCYVFHEYLASVNEGFWLRDVVESARGHGLEYVGDAQFCRWEGHVPSELKEALAKRDLNPIEQEEAADLLGDRYFRASVLCQADVPRCAVHRQNLLGQVYVATSLSADSDPFDIAEGVVERFTAAAGTEVTLDAAITKAAIVLLSSQWPRGMREAILYERAADLLTTHGCKVRPTARAQLKEELILLFETGQVEFRVHEPTRRTAAAGCFEAHALARFEAEHRNALTTPYHVPIPFSPEAMALVREMDGSRSHNELERAFGQHLVEQTLSVLERWGLLA